MFLTWICSVLPFVVCSGKGESAADYVLHLGKLSAFGYGDPHDHDVAADSYHRYKEDIAAAVQLKVYLLYLNKSSARRVG